LENHLLSDSLKLFGEQGDKELSRLLDEARILERLGQ